MIKITPAPIVKEKIEFKKEIEILQPLEAFMGKLGTDSLQLVEEGIFDLLKVGVDKFKDGFQISDLSIIISLYSPLKGISDNIEQAKLELADLDDNEAGANIEYVVDNILTIFGVDLKDNGEMGTESLELVMNKLFEAVKIIKTAVADGIDLEDVKELPELFGTVVAFALAIGDAVEEAQDLSGSEIGDVARDFVQNTLYLVRL